MFSRSALILCADVLFRRSSGAIFFGSYIMNNAQKKTILIACILSTLMVCYPPFHVRFSGTVDWHDAGYSLIINPPLVSWGEDLFAQIDIERLLLQLAGLWLISGIFVVGLKK